jgi:hypothetical protein
LENLRFPEIVCRGESTSEGGRGVFVVKMEDITTKGVAEAKAEGDVSKMEDTTKSEVTQEAVEGKAAEVATTVAAPTKKLWSDEDFGDVDISGMQVTDPDDIVDKPEHIRSKEVVEPEIIKKVGALR